MGQVGVGLIGCGNMGRSLVTAAAALDFCVVPAVCDAVAESATKLAEELGAEAAADAADLLARDDITAVLVAAPNFTHCELTCQAAQAGKHVFVEKPMALNTADCTRMIETAQANGVKLMVGQVLRYIPSFCAMLDLLRTGDLGEPFAIRTTRISGGWSGQHRAPWRLKKELSGGPLFEVSQHELDFMRCVLGDVQSVGAVMGNFREKEIDYEDLDLLLLDFKQGGKGCLMAGHAAVWGSYDGMILCTKGSIQFNGFGSCEYMIEGREKRQLSAEGYEPGVQREVREFLEAVRDDTAPTIPGEEGRKNVAIAEAAHLAAREQRMVPVAY